MSRFDEILGIKVHMCHSRINAHTLYHGGNPKNDNNNFTLIFVTSGLLEVKLGKLNLTISKNECFIWQKDEPKILKSSPKSAASCYILQFTPIAATGEIRTVEELGIRRIVSITDHERMTTLFTDLDRNFRSVAKFRMQNSSITAMQILQMMNPDTDTLVERMPSYRSPSGEERITSAIAYIHKNFKKRISVVSLAKHACMHPVNFAKLFRSETGISPHEYILERKIEKAKDFLLHFGEQPVTVAAELGFHDYSHFFRTFKRITGKAPKEFIRS